MTDDANKALIAEAVVMPAPAEPNIPTTMEGNVLKKQKLLLIQMAPRQ